MIKILDWLILFIVMLEMSKFWSPVIINGRRHRGVAEDLVSNEDEHLWNI
jgi:hypothetical protein